MYIVYDVVRIFVLDLVIRIVCLNCVVGLLFVVRIVYLFGYVINFVVLMVRIGFVNKGNN